MACEHELIGGILRINCKDCMFGSSIEDYDSCFGMVINKLLEARKVERIILAGSREHEYDFEQTKVMIEIAQLYEKLVKTENILNYSKLGRENCERCFPKRFSELQMLLGNMLKKDPIGTYIQIKRIIRRERSKIQKEQAMCKRCIKFFIDNTLIPIQERLEKTKIINLVKDKIHGHKIGDRSLYREIFHPLVRPTFMLTRYKIIPPKTAKLVDRYSISNIQIKIFKIPEQVRYYYHISAPEFQLSDEQYTILDQARLEIIEYKPSETEFTHPEMARESFREMGRTRVSRIAGGMGVNLSEKELKQITYILVRYTAGFGILEVLLADSKIQDVYINSPIGTLPVYILHDDFEECETNLIPTREDAEGWATRFRLFSGRPLDEANPVLDTELFVPGAKARVAAITRTLSPDGIAYSLRRHRERPWTYPLFMNVNYVDPLFAGLMSFLIDGTRTILFAGGRSSGKTSLLSASMLEIMKKFRIVTVEDTLELPVVQFRNLGFNIERLKSRSVITRVERELPADEALRTALRLGDSCLIVGEVRSTEALALYEAMRIGALANVVAGTIHGESPYGVFDRVVNDLGVPPASFKATDIIVICGRLRTADGLHTFRRVLEVTEVRKQWKTDPMEENGFIPLLKYSAKEDILKPTDTLVNGESFIINEISKRSKDWHGNWDGVWSNIELRGKIKKSIVDYSNKLNRPDIMEADWTVKCNEMFHLTSDEVRKEVGSLDSRIIYDKWLKWFKESLK